MGIFMLALGIALIGMPAFIYFNAQPSRHQSAEATAEVTRLTSSQSSDMRAISRTSCRVHYVFEADGAEYTGESAIGATGYCSYNPGDQIAVRYNPTSPRDNSFADNPASHNAFLAIFAAIGLVVTALATRTLIRARR
ncbi:MAG: DUF3592 domain-containing protein [Bifidobacteriaceae bacterium]|jgi:hypothetical protein|nr:DUF3592 domain-containing protein [Bifidobacteriaceae bacterium]